VGLEQLYAQPFPVPGAKSQVAASTGCSMGVGDDHGLDARGGDGDGGKLFRGSSAGRQACRNGVNGSGVQPQLMRKKQYFLIKSRRKFS
jgi:hypothetical protein